MDRLIQQKRNTETHMGMLLQIDGPMETRRTSKARFIKLD